MTFEDMGIERRNFMKAAAVAAVATLGATAACPAIADEAATLASIEERLWICEAKEAIREKLYLYCRSDDRQDPEIGYQVFHEDGTADYGVHPLAGEIYKGSGHGLVDQLMGTDRGITERGGHYAHIYTNPLIYVNGTQAGSETYSLCPLVSMAEDGSYGVMLSVGRHCDKWDYKDGEWRISERYGAGDYALGWPLTSLVGPYDIAAKDKGDFSYDVFAYGQVE